MNFIQQKYSYIYVSVIWSHCTLFHEGTESKYLDILKILEKMDFQPFYTPKYSWFWFCSPTEHKSNCKILHLWKREVPGIQWLQRLALPLQGAWVYSLVWELRSHILCSAAKQNTHTHLGRRRCHTQTQDNSPHLTAFRKLAVEILPLGEKHLHIQEQKMCNIYDYFNNTLCLSKVQSTKWAL